MQNDFTHSVLGNTGIKVHRLGLSATYRPGRETIYKALDAGINYFFLYGFDTHMKSVLRELSGIKREKFLIATGGYNYIWWHSDIRRAFEKRLRQLKTDYIDIFLFLGVMKEKQFPQKVLDDLHRLREEGKVRAIGLSTHDRKFAGRLAQEGAVDILMIRYNAAHRGAEEDIFPHLEKHNPGVVSYTATRWTYLIRKPRGYDKNARIPTAGECYRFVLSNPHVDICMTAPKNLAQLEENLASLEKGPLDSEEMEFIKKFGDRIHHSKKWFM